MFYHVDSELSMNSCMYWRKYTHGLSIRCDLINIDGYFDGFLIAFRQVMEVYKPYVEVGSFLNLGPAQE